MQLIKSIQAHTDKVWSVSAHPTLPLLVTASTDLTLKIYKLLAKQNFPLVNSLEDTHKRSIRSVSFKPPLGGVDSPAENFLDLPTLASGSFDATISVWGIDEPSEEYDDEVLIANQAEILSSPDNEWNIMAVIEGHENEIKCVDWNFQGNLLASCSRDKTVWIWETDPETLEEFECVSVLNDHAHDVKHVTWHPSQNLLASSSYDDTIRLYKQDLDDDWSCVGILNGHEGTVWCSQFEDPKSPGATEGIIRLVSVSDDLTVRVWSSKELPVEEKGLPSSIKKDSEMIWEQDSVFPQVHTYSIYSVCWSKKSGRVASTGADGRIVIYKEGNDGWVVESIQEAAHSVYEINSIVWAVIDEKEVLISGGEDGCVNVWETS